MASKINQFDAERFLTALNEVIECAQRATPCERTGKEATIIAVNPNGEARYCPIRWKISTNGKLISNRPIDGKPTDWRCQVELTLNQDRWYDPRDAKARPPAISDDEICAWLAQKGYPFNFLREPRRLAPVDRYSKVYGIHVAIYR